MGKEFLCSSPRFSGILTPKTGKTAIPDRVSETGLKHSLRVVKVIPHLQTSPKAALKVSKLRATQAFYLDRSSRMRLTVLSLISILSLSATGLAHGQQVVDDSASKIGVPELDALFKSAPQFLKDPMSAQFSKLRKDPSNADYVCGEVNAKNAFGGYVGSRYFRYGLKNGMLIMTETSC